MRRKLTLLTALGAFLMLAGVTPRASGEEQQGKKVDAATDEVSLEDLLNAKISVTSTQGETILESSSVVTVVDRKMIEQHGYRTVEEALQSVAGITVMRSYLLQGMVTSRGVLQDLYANKNLVLINNVPAWHAVTGESRIERVGINDVERIEVLKGPASVLYGSQAYTSAINIVTRSAKPGTQSADATIGTRGESGSFRMAAKSGAEFSVGVNRDLGQRINYNFLDENGTTGVVRDYEDAFDTTMQAKYKGNTFLLNAYDSTMNTFGSAPAFKTGREHATSSERLLTSYQFDHIFAREAERARPRILRFRISRVLARQHRRGLCADRRLSQRRDGAGELRGDQRGQRRSRHRLRVPEDERGDQPKPAHRRDPRWLYQQRRDRNVGVQPARLETRPLADGRRHALHEQQPVWRQRLVARHGRLPDHPS